MPCWGPAWHCHTLVMQNCEENGRLQGKLRHGVLRDQPVSLEQTPGAVTTGDTVSMCPRPWGCQQGVSVIVCDCHCMCQRLGAPLGAWGWPVDLSSPSFPSCMNYFGDPWWWGQGCWDAPSSSDAFRSSFGGRCGSGMCLVQRRGLSQHRGFLAPLAHQYRGAEGSTEVECLYMEQLEALDLENELWFGCAGGVVWGQAQHPLKE